MGGLRRGMLVLIFVGLLGFASTEALGQTIDGLTEVTTTLTDAVSGATDTVSDTTGESTSDDGDSSGETTEPITSATSSLTGGESGGTGGESGGTGGESGGGGTTEESKKSETTEFDGSSIRTMSCGEASRDPRTFGAFLVTLKEGERGAPSTRDGEGKSGGGVAAAAESGEEESEAAPPVPEPSPIPDAPDGFPAWIGLLALAALGLGFAALIAIVAKSFLEERTATSPPSSGGPVRRSL
jgi:hypothetical protein